MPYRISEEPEYLRVELFGVVTPDDLRGMIDEGERLEISLDPTPHRITDATGITEWVADYRTVSRLAAHRRGTSLKNRVRSAIVVGSGVDMGYARMFQTLNDHPQIEVRIFERLDAALEWLRPA